MIENRIAAIESTIESAPNIPGERKTELLQLVAELKSEVNRLAETHHEEASSITRFADASAHEASRAEKNPQLADTAMERRSPCNAVSASWRNPTPLSWGS